MQQDIQIDRERCCGKEIGIAFGENDFIDYFECIALSASISGEKFFGTRFIDSNHCSLFKITT